MKIAILGLGTIGKGVYELLKKNKDIEVKRILDIRAWMEIMTTDINDIVNDAEIETVVETMGGLHPAREFALKCIQSGKNYVTANKLLVSECARELSEEAAKHNAAFLFSASCGGGIPYLSNLARVRESDTITKVGGILNGTTNFILDKVFTENAEYSEALKQAQELGYAEKDPSSDIDGLDTQRKLVLACAVAFSLLPSTKDVPALGIRNLSGAEVDYARANDSVIRLCAYGSLNDDGTAEAFVVPAMKQNGSSESAIHKNINYACYEGEKIGEFAYIGQGAGSYPTASNIVSDIRAIIGGQKNMLPADFKDTVVNNINGHAFYLRVKAEYAPEVKAFSDRVVYENDSFVSVITGPVSINTIYKAALDEGFAMIIE